MMKLGKMSSCLVLLLLSLNSCSAEPHKYWVCGITSYQSTVNGISQQGECRTNTAYSKPPCREFWLDHDGDDGVNPDKSYEHTANSISTLIEIQPASQKHSYHHSIRTKGNHWIYSGFCNYFEAPVGEKIYMDKGLVTE